MGLLLPFCLGRVAWDQTSNHLPVQDLIQFIHCLETLTVRAFVVLPFLHDICQLSFVFVVVSPVTLH